MIDLNELPMRIAVGQMSELTDEQLAFAVQCGAKDIQLNTPDYPERSDGSMKTCWLSANALRAQVYA